MSTDTMPKTAAALAAYDAHDSTYEALLDAEAWTAEEEEAWLAEEGALAASVRAAFDEE